MSIILNGNKIKKPKVNTINNNALSIGRKIWSPPKPTTGLKSWNFNELKLNGTGAIVGNEFNDSQGMAYSNYPVFYPLNDTVNGFNLRKIGDYISFDIRRTGSTTRWAVFLSEALTAAADPETGHFVSYTRDIGSYGFSSASGMCENGHSLMDNYTNFKFVISNISGGYLYFNCYINNVLVCSNIQAYSNRTIIKSFGLRAGWSSDASTFYCKNIVTFRN